MGPRREYLLLYPKQQLAHEQNGATKLDAFFAELNFTFPVALNFVR